MKRRHVFGVVAAFSLLSGCWLQPGYGPARHNANPFEAGLTEANVGALTQTWVQPTQITLGSQPLATGSVVVASGQLAGQFRVVAVDHRTGALRWQRDLADQGPGGSAVLSIAEDEVLVIRDLSTGGGELTTLDLATGATTETVSLDESTVVDATTAVLGVGVIAYRAADPLQGRYDLVARSRETFALLWTSPIGAFSQDNLDPLVMGEDQIYASDNSQSPVIHAFPVGGCGAATCNPTWTTPVPALPSPDDRQLGSYLLAATNDGHLLVRHHWSNPTTRVWRNDLVALTSDGQIDWITPLSELGGAAVAGDQVYVTGRDAGSDSGYIGMAAIQASTGAVNWWADAPSWLEGAPIVAGGLVYARGSESTDILVLDADGCGEPMCHHLEVVSTGGYGSGGTDGWIVAGATLFVSKSGNNVPDAPIGRLMAFRPSG